MKLQITRPTKPVDSIQFMNETGFDLVCVEDEFFLIGEATEAELLAAYEAHTVIVPAEPTIEEKLESVGLSIPDLKAALGL